MTATKTTVNHWQFSSDDYMWHLQNQWYVTRLVKLA